jgi:hypothetical protein
MRRVWVLALLPLAGCSSTQSKSAALKAAAVDRPQERAFTVGKANPDVRFGPGTILHDENGTAVVLPVRAKAGLQHVPLSFDLLTGDGARAYRNDTPGLDTSLVSVPVLERGKSLLWVDDQVIPTGDPVKIQARAGDAKPLGGAPPKIQLQAVKLVVDATEGQSVTGRVHNASTVEQRRLVIYLAGLRGTKVTAAGRAIVPRLKAGATAKFTAFLIGDPKGVRITAAAPPTTLP